MMITSWRMLKPMTTWRMMHGLRHLAAFAPGTTLNVQLPEMGRHSKRMVRNNAVLDIMMKRPK